MKSNYGAPNSSFNILILRAHENAIYSHQGMSKSISGEYTWSLYLYVETING